MKLIKQMSVIMTVGLMSVSSVYAQDSSAGFSLFTKTQKVDYEGIELYENNLDMKSFKNLGVGFVAGGVSGLLGLSFEYNWQPENAFFAGFGTGKGHNTWNLGWKRNFEGHYMSPYTKVAFSRWTESSNMSGNPAKDSHILNSILTDNEIAKNKFGVNFISGAMGLEYNQLEGELAGLNLFGEVLVLSEVERGKLIPTGSVGVTYFF